MRWYVLDELASFDQLRTSIVTYPEGTLPQANILES